MSPLTTLLFVPGSRPDRFAKAATAGAGVACIDLEDSVPADGKETAREAAVQALATSPELAIRINGLRTHHGLRDLLALRDAGLRPSLVLLPMADGPGQVAIVREVLGLSDDRVVPLIETAAALRIAHDIAAAPGVAAMMFGGGDLAAELGVALAWEPLAVARAQFVLACRGAGVGAIDVPFIRLDDEPGLVAETIRAMALGFTGKAAIHPDQVGAIAAIFTPSDDDVATARAALDAYRAGGGGAVRHAGVMLEAPAMNMYKAIVAREQGHA